MRKYWIVTKNMWSEILTYRTNFIMWRVRVVLLLISTYYLWLAVLPNNGSIFGYTKEQLLTYAFLTTLMQSIVMATRSAAVGDEINSGQLSNFLIRPMNYFLYWFSKDMADKLMNISFTLVELSIFYVILHPPLFIQTNIMILFLTLCAILLAIFLNFFIIFILGTIGFWTPEVWAPRFIFYVISGFFSGLLFPLDIFPKSVFAIFQMLPFTYMIYFPLKIYLGQLAINEIYFGLFVSMLWVISLCYLLQFLWKKGLIGYAAYGR